MGCTPTRSRRRRAGRVSGRRGAAPRRGGGMSTRTTALLGLALFVAVAFLLAVVARGDRAFVNEVDPPTTYINGPGGASALAEALTGIGMKVERSRKPWRALHLDADSALFVVLSPTDGIAPSDVGRIAARAHDIGPVLLAGRNAGSAMACWGWSVQSRGRDSIRVTHPGERPPEDAPWVTDVLVPAAAADRPEQLTPDAGADECFRMHGRIDTILVTAGNRQ